MKQGYEEVVFQNGEKNADGNSWLAGLLGLSGFLWNDENLLFFSESFHENEKFSILPCHLSNLKCNDQNHAYLF